MREPPETSASIGSSQARSSWTSGLVWARRTVCGALLGRLAADGALDAKERGDALERASSAIGDRRRTAVAGGGGERVLGRVDVDLELRERPDGMLGGAARRVEIGHGGRVGAGPGPLSRAIAQR